LDCLPVERGLNAEEDANSKSSSHAEYASQKSDQGRSSESEPLTERGEFRQTRDLQRTRSVNPQFGTARATSVAIERADYELSSAPMAGGASFRDDDSFGCRHWWAPKIVLCLIRYFRHKEFFFRCSRNRKRITKARYCKDDSYNRPGGRAAAREGKNYAIQP